MAAGALGIDAAAHKLNAFVISALFAAAAGALSAHYAGFITPAKASFLHSIELVTMVVFGGMASTFGAVVGAAVLTTLPQLLTVFKEYEMVLLGAVLMLTMIFMPRGLVPTLESACCCAQDIGKRFGVAALEAVDVELERGAVHAIIGPNGAGKTTLLNVLSGIYKPDSGSISSKTKSSQEKIRTSSPPSGSAARSRTCRCSST